MSDRRRYFIHCQIAGCDVMLPVQTNDWDALGSLQLEAVGQAMVAAIPGAIYQFATEDRDF